MNKIARALPNIIQR